MIEMTSTRVTSPIAFHIGMRVQLITHFQTVHQRQALCSLRSGGLAKKTGHGKLVKNNIAWPRLWVKARYAVLPAESEFGSPVATHLLSLIPQLSCVHIL